MSTPETRSMDRPAAIVGVVLLAVAGLIFYDASHMSKGATYGIGPTAMPRVLALFFAGLALAHFVTAFRGGLPSPGEADWTGFGYVAGGLFSLIAVVAVGGGFILGATLLFALTARAFGRKAFLTDVAIGFAIGLLVFLLFNNLLSLTLPQGPLERLL